MSARNTPLVPQPTGDTRYNVRDAALHGASSAFSKPPVKPKPQTNTYTGGGNGALLAATKVGASGALRTTTLSGTQTPLSRDWTGGSTRSAARSHASPMQPLSMCKPSFHALVTSFCDTHPSSTDVWCQANRVVLVLSAYMTKLSPSCCPRLRILLRSLPPLDIAL